MARANDSKDSRVQLLACALIVGAALLACKKNKQSEAPAASAASTAPAPIATIASIAPFQISEGQAPNGVWTPPFDARLDGASAGKDYLEAAAACRNGGNMLCSETQWQRACAGSAAVATAESWTASWDGQQVVVRGGGNCETRKLVSGTEKSPARAAFCCSRAIGLRTGNKNTSFLRSAEAQQIRFERATNERNVEALADEWADVVHYDGKALPKAKVRTEQVYWFNTHADQWTFYDVCDIKLGPVPSGVGPGGQSPGLIHDCAVVTATGGQVSVLRQKLSRFQFEGTTKPVIVEVVHHSRTRKLAPL